MLLEYSRVRPDALPPTRGHPSDAGLDVYYCPQDPQEVGRNLKPGDSVILPTGLRFGVPHGYMLEVKNRSSLASKRSLIVGACVVDSGYDGEIFINIHNIGNEDQFVAKGTKIAQLVMIPVVSFRAIETASGDLYEWYPITISDRGEGALGSTGE
jgi:dUTP pyrophosphatase